MLAQKWDHHTLLAEVPTDLPYLISHTIPTRTKIFSTSCCPLPSSNRPRHHWVPYHTRHFKPIASPQVSLLFLLCKHYMNSRSSFVVHLIHIIFALLIRVCIRINTASHASIRINTTSHTSIRINTTSHASIRINTTSHASIRIKLL